MRPQREIARDWCLHSPILLLSSVLFPQLPGLPVPEQELADKYGVVISTSHHEPMQRAMNEWFDEPYYGPEQSWSWIRNKEKISKYFVQGAQRATRFEGVITIGMRGDGDREMDGENPQELLEEVLSTQRRIIKDVYGREDAVPQVIALYKEVQEYYENGLAIPEDVTLLFANDNFGTIRRLPTDTERTRRGGAGLYHHLEYVGEPRSYKWLNSNSLAKVWHQLVHCPHLWGRASGAFYRPPAQVRQADCAAQT